MGQRSFGHGRCPLWAAVPELQALDEVVSPGCHALNEAVEGFMIDAEVLGAEPPDGREGVGKDAEVEPGVLLSRQLQQAVSSEVANERLDVKEVPRLGPPEQRQHLVGRQLLQCQHRSQVGLLGREQAGVVGQIDLAGLPGRRCAESDDPSATRWRSTAMPLRSNSVSRAGRSRATAAGRVAK